MRPTGDAHFPCAERADGRWWVVRINAFPDHPLYTVLVDGRWSADHEDRAWEIGLPLRPEDVVAALATVRGLTAFGSESGAPCECPYC